MAHMPAQANAADRRGGIPIADAVARELAALAAAKGIRAPFDTPAAE